MSHDSTYKYSKVKERSREYELSKEVDIETLPRVKIYADGAGKNPGRAAYATILSGGGKTKALTGCYAFTTTNRMEMMGIIIGLEALRVQCYAEVFSDSRYVVNGINTGWRYVWNERSSDWKKEQKTGLPVPNTDLWDRLFNAMEKHKVIARWVRRNSIAPHEECDRLAKETYFSAEDISEDFGYLDRLDLKRSLSKKWLKL